MWAKGYTATPSIGAHLSENGIACNRDQLSLRKPNTSTNPKNCYAAQPFPTPVEDLPMKVKALLPVLLLTIPAMTMAADLDKLVEAVDQDKAVESGDVDKLKGSVDGTNVDYKKAYDSVDKDKAADSVDMDKVKDALGSDSNSADLVADPDGK
jgi:hypothetical protein